MAAAETRRGPRNRFGRCWLANLHETSISPKLGQAFVTDAKMVRYFVHDGCSHLLHEGILAVAALLNRFLEDDDTVRQCIGVAGAAMSLRNPHIEAQQRVMRTDTALGKAPGGRTPLDDDVEVLDSLTKHGWQTANSTPDEALKSDPRYVNHWGRQISRGVPSTCGIPHP